MARYLPGPDADELTAYLEASAAWTRGRVLRGGQIWEHDTGAQVAIPIEGHFADDGDLLRKASLTIARAALGISDDEAGFAEAIRRLAAAVNDGREQLPNRPAWLYAQGCCQNWTPDDGCGQHTGRPAMPLHAR